MSAPDIYQLMYAGKSVTLRELETAVVLHFNAKIVEQWPNPPRSDVVVAQAQTITKMHIDLIKTVMSRHERVMVALGVPAKTKVTLENPLDFKMRLRMLQQHFGADALDIFYVPDVPGDDRKWSRNLDREISRHIAGERQPLIYGSRDSFLKSYQGRFATAELVSEMVISGKELRRVAGNRQLATEDFRAGVIWATQNRYATVFPTVDSAVFNCDASAILLGQKDEDNGKWRFPGGFIMKKFRTAEANVRRETGEETGAEITDPKYVCSMVVDDPHYPLHANDGIMTLLFASKHLSGRLDAGDDLDAIKWFQVQELRENLDELVVATHRPLMLELFKALDANRIW